MRWVHVTRSLSITSSSALVLAFVVLVFQSTAVMSSLPSLHETASDDRAGNITDYCDTEEFEARCGPGEAVLLTWARYGRMRLGRCVEIDLGYIGCSRDVLALADRRCSGRSTCSIRVPDRDFENTRPCLRELKSYLEVAYKCVKVCTDKETVSQPPIVIDANVTAVGGFFSSVVSREAGCVLPDKPWTIKVGRGQTINMTLYDFDGEAANSSDVNAVESSPTCRDYGYIEDSARSKPVQLCGGRRRVENIFSSQGNVVKVWTSATDHVFMLEYTVIGCADLEVPTHVSFERNDNGALLRCTENKIEWSMSCQGHTWIGESLNCSKGDDPILTIKIDEDPRTGIQISLGAASGIIVGAAVLVCLIILIVGLIRYHRSRCMSHDRKQSEEVALRSASSTHHRQHHRQHHHHNGSASNNNQQPPPPPSLPPPPPPSQQQHQTTDGCSVQATTQPTCLQSPASTCPVECRSVPLSMSNSCVSDCRNSPALGKTLPHVVRINGSEYEHIWETAPPHVQQQQLQSSAAGAPASGTMTVILPSAATHIPCRDCRAEVAAAAAAAGSNPGSPSRSSCKRPAALYTPYKHHDSPTLVAPGRLGLHHDSPLLTGIKMPPPGSHHDSPLLTGTRMGAREKPLYITARDICSAPMGGGAAGSGDCARFSSLERRRADGSRPTAQEMTSAHGTCTSIHSTPHQTPHQLRREQHGHNYW